MNRILAFLGFHVHHYGVIHRNSVGVIVQTCYECSRERVVKAELEAV